MTESAVSAAGDLPSDDVLVAAYREDAAQFAPLYERYRVRLYRYLRALGATDDEAIDRSALAFERALRSLHGYRPRGGGFGAWLFRIARNVHIDERRRGARGIGLDAARDVALPEPDHDETVTLRLLVAALPEDTRQAIALRYAGGLSAREIGSVIGKRPDAVQKLIERGLATLREALHDNVD
jgi:RNA polymerase sigma-70 factor (ECF subfamily)